MQTLTPNSRKRNGFSILHSGGVVLGLLVLFALFTFGIWKNPPGYYVDESAISYNAYLVAETGAGESGVKFPLFFPVYTGPYVQYANPTHIYLLAAVFKIFGPGIITAKLLAAACVFAACILMGLLARSISDDKWIGIIVGLAALATPWLFEVGRLVLETYFYPMAIVLLLWSVYRASLKDRWSLLDRAAIVVSLMLATYSYTIGRLLGPLLAGGLLLFITSRKRLYSVLSVWAGYALLLVPLAVYIYENPAITKRFNTLSYVDSESPVLSIATQFIARFAEDVNPVVMLIGGDGNPRHHLPGGQGSFYFGVFILAAIGIGVVAVLHRRSSWWLYVVFGLLASAVPGALTNDQFHTLRMIGYPLFLIILTVPALCWLMGIRPGPPGGVADPRGEFRWPSLRQSVLTAVLTISVVQAGHFFWLYHRDGADRGEYFDASYKTLYEEAVARPERPIYLVDGYWGPAYIHAYWYATLEKRDLSEFVHLPYRERPPDGALVLSSEKECPECEMIRQDGDFLLYLER